MPELPEVETIVRELNRKIAGKNIRRFNVPSPVIFESWAPTIPGKLSQLKVESIRRHGKFIFWDLFERQTSRKHVLKVHLGMTGQLLFLEKNKPQAKHTHVIINFTDLKEELRYQDIRRFGYFEFMEGGLKLNNLGPDAWTSKKETIFNALRKKKGLIKHALLNQSVVAGLGNIYVDESLFRTKIHPLKKMEKLSNQKIQDLCVSIHSVLKESIDLGGTSFRNYVDTSGGRGGFKGRLNVYGKENTPCIVCSTLIKKIVAAGRGTHFCPNCQGR